MDLIVQWASIHVKSPVNRWRVWFVHFSAAPASVSSTYRIHKNVSSKLFTRCSKEYHSQITLRLFKTPFLSVCLVAGEDEELATLVERLDKTSTAYGMEISAEKTKLVTNNTSGIDKEIKVNGQKPEAVTSFKNLGSVVSDKDSKPNILSGKHRRQQH